MSSFHSTVANGESELPLISPTEYRYTNATIQSAQKPIKIIEIVGGTSMTVGVSITNIAAVLMIAIAILILLK